MRSDVEDALDAAGVQDPARRAVAFALYTLMSDISEDYYCAGWMHGLEAYLWQRIEDPTDDWLCREHLRQLAGLCGGWWAWHDDARKGPRFVPLDAWRREVASPPQEQA